VLKGQSPSNLKEVLAFICLSVIVGQALRSKGRLIDQVGFWNDFPKWRDAIPDDTERSVFCKIAMQIWPECIDALQDKAYSSDWFGFDSHFEFWLKQSEFLDLMTHAPDAMLKELDSNIVASPRTSFLGDSAVF
jgi:hypothetical protein